MTWFAWLGTGNDSWGDEVFFWGGLALGIVSLILLLLFAVRVVFKSTNAIKTNNKWYVKVAYLVIGIIAAYIAGMIIFTLT